MLFRGAGEEDAKKITIELEKPLPGMARRQPSQREREQINAEWASFMSSTG